jgi:hypothetical protein
MMVGGTLSGVRRLVAHPLREWPLPPKDVRGWYAGPRAMNVMILGGLGAVLVVAAKNLQSATHPSQLPACSLVAE